MTEPTKVLNDAEIRIRGIKALHQELGIAATLKFLALMHQSPTDYVQISRQIYQDQPLDAIFARASQNWKG